MAVSDDFRTFVVEQLGRIMPVTSRRGGARRSGRMATTG